MCDYMNDDVMDSDSIFSLNVTILNETENNTKVFQAQWYIDSETCCKYEYLCLYLRKIKIFGEEFKI